MTKTPQHKDDIFHAAAEIADPQQRAAYLEASCGGDSELRNEVLALLEHDAAAGSFMQQPAIADNRKTQSYQAISEGPGTKIGPYTLREQIGEGGFGLVFVAEQQKPVRRKVALKIIKPGMDTKEVIARFEGERQALALMDHPNIARIFDAGTTESGRPYFVMELVKGIPITEYCDQQKLTTAERLDLFVMICKAVQHAHGKGVIHRDLKPNNILIAPHDGVPVVKIIDFGVAKAIGPQLTDKTIYTSYLQMIGTPLYMSPEQAEINQLDIDTRSDVYSLGVLLYELLTGETPFDRKRFSTAAFDEIRRIIKEEEPPRPSIRLSALGHTLTQVSLQRKTEPAKLTALVSGDLDWIVMKALDKDRTRRYETASAMAADVGRYLSEEAIEARSPSVGYRMTKFVRRNRVAITTFALLFAVMLTGTVVSTWQAVRANAEAERANFEAERASVERDRALEAERNLAETLDWIDVYILRSADPAESQNYDLPLRIAVERAARALKPDQQSPVVEASIRMKLGEAFMALANWEMAREQLQRAVEILRKEYGEDAPETVRAETLAAIADVWSHGPQDFERLDVDTSLVAAIERCQIVLPEDDPMWLRARQALGWVRALQGLKLWVKRKQSLRRDARELYDEAETILSDVLERRKDKLRKNHPDTLRTESTLGLIYCYKGETKHEDMYQKAADILEPLLATSRQELDSRHPVTLEVESRLGRAYRWLGRRSEAIALLKKACSDRDEVLGPEHFFTWTTRKQLATCYMDAGRFDLAEEQLENVRNEREKSGPFFQTLLGLCKLQRKDKKWDKAEELFRRILKDDADKDEADKMIPWLRYTIQIRLGQALTGQKRFEEAQIELDAGLKGLQRSDVFQEITFDRNYDEPIRLALQAQIDLCVARGNPEEVEEWKDKLTNWEEKKELPNQREAQ